MTLYFWNYLWYNVCKTDIVPLRIWFLCLTWFVPVSAISNYMGTAGSKKQILF